MGTTNFKELVHLEDVAEDAVHQIRTIKGWTGERLAAPRVQDSVVAHGET